MLLVIDECDYVGSSQLTNIVNIANDAPEQIRIIAASTPCGKHEEFYKWCTNATTHYVCKKEDIENFKFTDYVEVKGEGKTNGWTEVFAPSTVNEELLKINPDTKQTYLEDIKDQLTEMRYAQEVMAEFGEEEGGVYKKKYIEAAIEEGRRIGLKYFDDADITAEEIADIVFSPNRGPLLLGVDWDKIQSGCHLLILYFDKEHMNKLGKIDPCFKVLQTIVVPSGNFTYIEAVQKIIDLNNMYDFDWIVVDRGYGETQIEMLHKYGIAHPESGLNEKTVGYQFGQNIQVRDPFTMLNEDKPIKPFMVTNSVICFERYKIILNPKDKYFREQLEEYKVKCINDNGMPTYSSENEHLIDAMNLCILQFEQKYGDLFQNTISSKVVFLKELYNRRTKDRDARGLNDNVKTISMFGKNHVVKDLTVGGAKKRGFIGRGGF